MISSPTQNYLLSTEVQGVLGYGQDHGLISGRRALLTGAFREETSGTLPWGEDLWRPRRGTSMLWWWWFVGSGEPSQGSHNTGSSAVVAQKQLGQPEGELSGRISEYFSTAGPRNEMSWER